MPKIVDAPSSGELPGLPRLNDSEKSRKFLRMGQGKWRKHKHKIECVRIDGRDFYTDEALLKFVREQTIRPAGRASPPPTGGQPTPSTRRAG